MTAALLAGSDDRAPAPRYVCIHGHFYQPPRENPWLDAIERQESAAPYFDWNERITHECYAPNTRARLFNSAGRVTSIVNTFERISFNVGPTLLSWLAAHDPATYAAILDADRRGCERFGGHGPAIAQVYNHVIMPLANERDRFTQVRWGLADFRHRFGREPEGMWLAETAVDTPTLEALAAEGIRFTILSPLQAQRLRPLGEDWQDVAGGRIDPSRAYRCNLPSGRSIALFFYDGPVSSSIAFDGVLKSGERFVEKLLGAFHDERIGPQLVHAATDGETYGHHTRHGESALAHALEFFDSRNDIQLTTYGEFLERHPPAFEVEIVEDTAWSCAHGLGRWSADCGCRVRSDWKQSWRGPLREALDWLRDELTSLFTYRADGLLSEPWAARDDYIAVILGRVSFDDWSARNASGDPVLAHKLLEMQLAALLMYTSCGWFFDELSGLETVQILHYAARAIQLAEEIGGDPLEPAFLEKLAAAPSNLPFHADGRSVWDKLVRPVRDATTSRKERDATLAKSLEPTRNAIDAAFRAIFDDHTPAMRSLAKQGLPILPAFRIAAEHVLNLGLQQVLEADRPEIEIVRGLIADVALFDVKLDAAGLAFQAQGKISRLVARVANEPDSVPRAIELLEVISSLPFEVDLGAAQAAFLKAPRAGDSQTEKLRERLGIAASNTPAKSV